MSTLSTPVLVLNRTWTPLRITAAAEALADLFVGRVQEVDADYACYDFKSWRDLSAFQAEFAPDRHTFIRTARERILVPTVVRLNRFDRFKQPAVRLSRRNIHLRDRNTCQYCGRKLARSQLNIDHVVPRCQGGMSAWTNLVCSCVDCNTRKGGHRPEQRGMRLIRLPRKPDATALIFRQTKARHASWAAFVDAAYWNCDLAD
jgi:5-methylcytosine-specific restriction endonuclease McrA